MSYYRRGYFWEQTEYLPAPTAGWNPDSSPWEMRNNEAPQLDNFLLRGDQIIPRGGFKVTGDLSASAPLNVCGGLVSGNVLLARKSSGTVDPWNAPLTGTTSAALAAGNTSIQWVTNLGAITAVTVTADQIPGPRWVNFDGLLYGLGYDAVAAAVQDVNHNYFMKPTSLLTLSRTSPPTTATAAPGAAASSNVNGGTQVWSGIDGSNNPAPLLSGLTSTGIPSPDFATLAAQGGGFGIAAGQTSQVLEGTGFGFSVPAGATITGIQVSFLAANFDTPNSALNVTVAQLLKAGALAGTNRAASVPRSDATETVTLGGSSDLWGTTWAPADVNNANFGFGFAVNDAAGPGVAYTNHPQIADLRVTVYYTTTSSAPSPTVLSNAPHGGLDLKGHLSRLWVLGGVDTPGAGTTHSPNTLFYTNPIVSGGGTASADWKDPISGLTNAIPLDDRDTSNYGVALASVRGSLLVLRRNSVHVIRGTTNSTFAAILVSQETGCVDARSVVETDRGVYFIGPKGLMLTNGATIANVSGTVLRTLQAAIAQEQAAVVTGNGGYISSVLTSQGTILISIGTYSSGHIVPIWCGMFDPTTGTWVRITSQLWASDGNQVGTNYYPGLLLGNNNPRQVVAVGDKYVTTLEDQNAGISFLTGSSLYDQLPSGASPFLSIPAVWKTRYAPVIGTTTNSRRYGSAMRYFIDYTFGGSGIATPTGWKVTPIDSSDNAYTGATSLSAALGNTPVVGSVSGTVTQAVPRIQRQNQDFANEIADLAFSVTWSDPSAQASQPSNVVAELFGVGVEYQPGRMAR